MQVGIDLYFSFVDTGNFNFGYFRDGFNPVFKQFCIFF